MLPSETMIWQPEFTDKTLSRKPGAVQYLFSNPCSVPVLVTLEEVLLHAITCRNDSGPFISDTIKRSIKHILSASYRRSGTRS
ncbi:hypothetical protein DTQ12_28810 [Escherichia coli]|nr:hypothetical protein DTM45_27710 [Escherichia coli]RDA48900.1 hypothetical protein DTQ12_28810 [Escherichia coli]